MSGKLQCMDMVSSMDLIILYCSGLPSFQTFIYIGPYPAVEYHLMELVTSVWHSA